MIELQRQTYLENVNKVRELQAKTQRWFKLSAPFGAGALIEILRSGPAVIYKALENQDIGVEETLPFVILFFIWHLLYFEAEKSLIEMERRNFNLGVPVRYGFPERLISHLNLEHIELRRPSKNNH